MFGRRSRMRAEATASRSLSTGPAQRRSDVTPRELTQGRGPQFRVAAIGVGYACSGGWRWRRWLGQLRFELLGLYLCFFRVTFQPMHICRYGEESLRRESLIKSVRNICISDHIERRFEFRLCGLVSVYLERWTSFGDEYQTLHFGVPYFWRMGKH